MMHINKMTRERIGQGECGSKEQGGTRTRWHRRGAKRDARRSAECVRVRVRDAGAEPGAKGRHKYSLKVWSERKSILTLR